MHEVDSLIFSIVQTRKLKPGSSRPPKFAEVREECELGHISQIIRTVLISPAWRKIFQSTLSNSRNPVVWWGFLPHNSSLGLVFTAHCLRMIGTLRLQTFHLQKWQLVYCCPCHCQPKASPRTRCGVLEGATLGPWLSTAFLRSTTSCLLSLQLLFFFFLVCVFPWRHMIWWCLPANAGDMTYGFNSWVRKIPWRRAWQPTPVFLPGESHEQRSLAGYSPWGCKESDMTEATQHACRKSCSLTKCGLCFTPLSYTWRYLFPWTRDC